MRISSQALAILGKVFRQMSPSQGDLQITIPPIVQPQITLRQPTSEQIVNQTWNTSGFFQQGQQISTADPTSSITLCTLDKGMWEIICDQSYMISTIPASIPGFALALLFQDPATGLGGEVSTIQSGFQTGFAQTKSWVRIFAFSSPIQLISTISTLGATGGAVAFTCIQCNRLLD